ncbi:DUF5906 domain-containing protein [Prosthecomicrobium sp. N25]|uniref:DUF5906 domain-containing protein n=1 Tax=Prosthecomicrobium sp. N25 TaxID=3129254 RepID=UPI00307829DA
MSALSHNEDGRAEGIGAPARCLEKSVEFDFDGHEDTAPALLDTPSKHDPDALNAHASAGHDLIPLDGKRPVERGWRRAAPLSLARAKSRLKASANVGVRLRDTDLVVDVDPRHCVTGDDPFARLKKDFRLPDAPFVRTGGGGWHHYYRKPADVAVVDGLDGYAGVEFKSLGRQVVAAGSIHPDTGRPYGLDGDPLALSLSEAPEATTALLDAIRKAPRPSTVDAAEIAPELLADWLALVTVEDYREELKWRELMMACHAATGGNGVEEFVAWSTSDPAYADHGEKIRTRWNSLETKPGAITARTLIAALPKERRQEATEALGRSAPEEDFPADIEAEPPKRRSMAVWNDWVWVVEPYQFVRRSDTRKYRTEQWKSVFANLKPDGDVLGAIWKGNLPMRKFEALVYLPEADEFPDGEDGGRYNIWRKSGVEAVPGDVSVFLDHMAYLFPDESERAHVLDYLALLVQRPADKIHFALLVRGTQGTGKSWIGNLMERIVGSRNTVRPSNDEVTSRWTAWMEGAQLAVIEELMTLGRREVANRLKPAITDPTLRIEEKNCSIYSIPNCLNFLCFTNHEDALPIEHGDRRWLVVFSPAAKRDEDYYRRLFGYLAGGGAAHVKHWLAERRVALNPLGVAPATVGKEAMRRLGMGDAEAFLLDLFEAGEPPFDFDLVRVDDVVDAVPPALRGRSNLRARATKVLKGEIGAVEHTRYTKGDGSRPAFHLWSVRDHGRWRDLGAAGRIDAFTAFRTLDSLDLSPRR